MSLKPISKWESDNVGFACSHAMQGYGYGVAIACGKNTDVGAMTALSFKKRPKSRVERHLKQVFYYTLCVALIMILLLLITTGFERGEIVYEVNLSLLVALMPMYLPFILYWGLRRTKTQMRKKQCHVRNLRSASTVGLTTVIVTDLVGTMTKRRMRVTEIFVDMALLSANDLNANDLDPRFIELIQASVLCNDAVICPGNIGVPKMQKDMYGNILDVALLKFGLMMLPDIDLLRKDHEKVANKHYTNADKVQVTVHRTRDEEGQMKLILLMKGHCHVVLGRCSTFAIRDEEIPLDDQFTSIIQSVADGLLEAGRHVRAFAYKELSNELEFRRFSQVNANTGLESGDYKYRDYLAVDTFSLRFLGMIATHNPSRSTIPKAVARCRQAGIKLILVTSRKRHLAQALAEDVGIFSPQMDNFSRSTINMRRSTINMRRSTINMRRSTVNMGRSTSSMMRTGAKIVDMSLYKEYKPHHQIWEIEQLLLSERDLIFAATSRDQHLWIVESCRRLGGVVSVIGGTLNDTPAMMSGHVAVAKYGCAVMCEASADLILLDSSFATLIVAISDSRLLFENLKKALAYCLATNTTNILVFSCFFLLHIPLHLHIIDVLILAFLVNLLPALTLIYEFPEKRMMMQMPKVYDDILLNSRLIFVSHILVGTIEAAAVFTTYFVFMGSKGFAPKTLVGLHIVWHDELVDNITDTFGQEWRRPGETGVPGVLPVPDEPHHDAVHQPGVDEDGTCQSAESWLRQLATKFGGRLFDFHRRGDVPSGLHCLPQAGWIQRIRLW
ncbi:sodium/potassium-transporting ATPase subunit alpha isoform X2 [Drosophila ficusphila]|uniref:sodium/potassium-transporting ATPase subunit alpha isoform X2 n=1 Tax=Drosophila ficusphila TaxID=30025 RepID=UPI0007E81782|nr:sodium/potassium-transporting ATPase subunit alpha isoform X2 [Drosophila ficusphila]